MFDINFKHEKIKHPKWRYKLTHAYAVPIEIKRTINHPFVKIHNCLMIISKDYTWNGADWPSINTKNIRRASCIHDALCQMIVEKRLNIRHRKYADRLLREICIDDGMTPLRAWWVYLAVRAYALVRY